MADALTNLREIGTVAELRAAATATAAKPAMLPNNAHLHLPPNFSAFSNVEQAMALADEQDVRIIGASNYYDYAVYNDFAARARQHNILPLFGIEIICMIEELRVAGVKINDPGNPGKMYICGKGIVKFGNMPEEARQILGTIRRNDSERTSKMVDKIALLLAERGLPNLIDANIVANLVVRRHAVLRETVFLQERHVAQSLQEFIFSSVSPDQRIAKITTFLGAPPKMKTPEDSIGLQNDLRAHLMKSGKPGFVHETFIDFAPAIQLILALGGFPSYPILADGNNPICPFEDPVEKLVVNLKQRRIYAAELITGRNAQSTVIKYAKAIRGAEMIITAGTEHNTLDLIPMAPICMNKEPIPTDLQEMFYEGACVIAAHQFLAAHGEVGYTDSAGNLNPAYPDPETRIRELAKLGDTVIRRYLKMS